MFGRERSADGGCNDEINIRMANTNSVVRQIYGLLPYGKVTEITKIRIYKSFVGSRATRMVRYFELITKITLTKQLQQIELLRRR